MAETIAFLCPGQGAQQVGMGTDLIAEFVQAREVFAEADDILGFSLSGLCAAGPADDLMQTENAQPALLAMSVAIARTLESEGGIKPSLAAGHSLGEWSALVISGALDLPDALRAVRQRGLFMREAVPRGCGGMTALLGAEPSIVRQLCSEATNGPESFVGAANWNGGGQVVVAGHVDALDRLEIAARAAKHRATRLKVSQPFHSPLMQPARDRLEEVLAAISFRSMQVPVVANVTAENILDPSMWPELLAKQVTSPVRWEECATNVSHQASSAIEVGPGRVLSGLMRRIARGYSCTPTSTTDGIRDLLAKRERKMTDG
ncbi:ACP S-malonyltransferase [Candidatus Binatia bacterium]|nr:ACP S-malonyltransferase [Candidatus Binatia bacterium]